MFTATRLFCLESISIFYEVEDNSMNKKKQKKNGFTFISQHDIAPAKVSFYNVSTLKDLRDLLQRWFKPILTHYRLKKEEERKTQNEYLLHCSCMGLHGQMLAFFSSSDCLMLDPLNQYVWGCLFETSLCLRSKKQTVRNIRINVSLGRHLLAWAIVSAGVSTETVTQRRCTNLKERK